MICNKPKELIYNTYSKRIATERPPAFIALGEIEHYEDHSNLRKITHKPKHSQKAEGGVLRPAGFLLPLKTIIGLPTGAFIETPALERLLKS